MNLGMNVMHFGRLLRRVGIPVGTEKIILALRALEVIDVCSRTDFFWALHTIFVNRRDQSWIFTHTFHVFWRNPDYMRRMMSLLLPTVRMDLPRRGGGVRRLQEALGMRSLERGVDDGEHDLGFEVDTTSTWSDRERLYQKDFEQVTEEEMVEVKRRVEEFSLSVLRRRSRRWRTVKRGGERIDMLRTLRGMVRCGDFVHLMKCCRRMRVQPIVVLCDISGSMESYTRVVLHFIHGLVNGGGRVEVFVFATRLTCITRQMRYKDVDVALRVVGGGVVDWFGGTRLSECLHEFNRRWNRRVLGQGAIVLLITDGLDYNVGEGLRREMERLYKSSRWLIWLNPLLRYKDFVPSAGGIRVMMEYVDELRSVHNLESLGLLVRLLGERAVFTRN